MNDGILSKEMVEKAARVLFEHEWGGANGGCDHDFKDDKYYQAYLDSTRAALTAVLPLIVEGLMATSAELERKVANEIAAHHPDYDTPETSAERVMYDVNEHIRSVLTPQEIS